MNEFLFFTEEDTDRLSDGSEYLIEFEAAYKALLMLELIGLRISQPAHDLLDLVQQRGDPIAISDLCEGLSTLAFRTGDKTLLLNIIEASRQVVSDTELFVGYYNILCGEPVAGGPHAGYLRSVATHVEANPAARRLVITSGRIRSRFATTSAPAGGM